VLPFDESEAMTTELTRRRLLTTIGAVTGAALAVPQRAFGQSQGKPLSAPTVISNPPRDFGPDAPPTTYFADPDVLTIDPAFDGLIQANTSIKRLWTGALWAEGPAWNSQGRHPEQSADALAGRRRPGDGVS
jgi:gluconolactonase